MFVYGEFLVMVSPSEIEKKNLEAHVELCAERYKNLNDKLDTVESRVSHVEKKLDAKMYAMETILDEIKEMIVKMQQHRNKQLINWGIGIISSLIATIGFLTWHIITKVS
jgi:chromosome segregation ATPase